MMPYKPLLAFMTAFFEIGVALWILRTPGEKPLRRPVVAIFFLLAGYQLLEILLCSHEGGFLPRLAFADITWLPAIGVYLVARLGDWQSRAPERLFFGLATAFTLWILTDPLFVSGSVCHAVIATYRNPTPIYSLYGAYYQIGMLTMILGASHSMVTQNNPLRRQQLADVQTGTILFTFPALLTEIVLPSVEGSQPSMMCHYALFLAIFLMRLWSRERELSPQWWRGVWI